MDLTIKQEQELRDVIKNMTEEEKKELREDLIWDTKVLLSRLEAEDFEDYEYFNLHNVHLALWYWHQERGRVGYAREYAEWEREREIARMEGTY